VSDSRTYDGRLRIETYERYMREHGVADHVRVLIADQEPALGFALGQRMFAAPDGTTAIFATSDATAVGLMQAAYRAGVTMPDRLSIVGYDDIDLVAYTIPPLTTVTRTGVEMGRTATRLLLEMIDRELDRDQVEDVVLEPRLVVRASTAPPAP
jgi:LacI family transcriptional regulator